MRVTQKRVERIYDALPKRENGDAYYSMCAIRTILRQANREGIRD